MPPETEGDKRPATKAEKIEQLMGVTWEVEESDKLRAFAEKILRSAEIGESETAIRQLLAAYHVQEFGKSPNKGDNDRIIEWLKKAVAVTSSSSLSRARSRPPPAAIAGTITPI